MNRQRADNIPVLVCFFAPFVEYLELLLGIQEDRTTEGMSINSRYEPLEIEFDDISGEIKLKGDGISLIIFKLEVLIDQIDKQDIEYIKKVEEVEDIEEIKELSEDLFQYYKEINLVVKIKDVEVYIRKGNFQNAYINTREYAKEFIEKQKKDTMKKKTKHI